MLDDLNVISQRDPQGALQVAAQQFEQARFDASVRSGDNDGREITRVVVSGMGGSALAALVVKSWLKNQLSVPFEIVRTYSLPHYVDANTLVIASSYSGNTEETLSGLEEAKERGAQSAVIAAGGKLIDYAATTETAHVQLPGNLQPRMAVINNLRALVALLVH